MSDVGLIERLGRVSFSDTAKRFSAAIPRDPLAWIIRLVALAGVNAVWMHSGAPQFGIEQIAFNLTLGIAGLAGEYYLAREVCRSWHERTLLPFAGFAIVWAGAFAYSLNAWTGVASEGQVQKASIQKAAFISSSDTQSEMARAQERYDATKRDRDAMAKLLYEPLPTVAGKPVNSAAEARALMTSMESQTRFFIDLTERCTVTKGKQTREFCATYGQAKAALAAHDARGQTSDKLNQLNKAFAEREAELRGARHAALEAPLVTSDKRGDLRILVKYAGVSEETAMDINAMGKIILISLLLSGLGMLHENNHWRGKPRKRWPLIAWLSRKLYGTTADNHVEPGTLVLRETNTIEDPRALATIRQGAEYLRSRLQAA